MLFVLQRFQSITLLLFHSFFEHINNNDQQGSNFSKYFCHVWTGGYQPLGGGSSEKWDNELEDKLFLIWNGWQSDTEAKITSVPYPPWTHQH